MYVITIIYDSKSGHTKKMAEAVVRGVKKTDEVQVKISHIDDANPEDLVNSDGVIIGSPTHCGLLSWKLKKFFDENTSVAWGKVNGKIATAFSSSGGLGGGNEMTTMSILNTLMNYGYMVFGLPDYAAPGVTAHYGSVAVGDPDENALKSCELLGQRTAEYVKKMNSF
ncbi:MAG: flavodoxin family protein [Halanaerobiales bacterium]